MARFFSHFFSTGLALLALAAGCVSAPTPTAPQSLRCRPQIALVPVINGTNVKLPWNLESELTEAILDNLMCDGTFWVSPFNQFQCALDQTKGRDYFGADLSFANHFSHNDFIVIAELVEHEIKPYNREEYPDLQVTHTPERHQVLTLAIRLRVIDLRYEEPVIVRQEIVEIDKLVTPRAAKITYEEAQVPDYASTPLCKGHRELAELVVEKVKEAVFCNW